jgi:hypothetical protein
METKIVFYLGYTEHSTVHIRGDRATINEDCCTEAGTGLKIKSGTRTGIKT